MHRQYEIIKCSGLKEVQRRRRQSQRWHRTKSAHIRKRRRVTKKHKQIVIWKSIQKNNHLYITWDIFMIKLDTRKVKVFNWPNMTSSASGSRSGPVKMDSLIRCETSRPSSDRNEATLDSCRSSVWSTNTTHQGQRSIKYLYSNCYSKSM